MGNLWKTYFFLSWGRKPFATQLQFVMKQWEPALRLQLWFREYVGARWDHDNKEVYRMTHMHKNMQSSAETEPRIETPATTPREVWILNLKFQRRVFLCSSGTAFNIGLLFHFFAKVEEQSVDRRQLRHSFKSHSTCYTVSSSAEKRNPMSRSIHSLRPLQGTLWTPIHSYQAKPFLSSWRVMS